MIAFARRPSVELHSPTRSSQTVPQMAQLFFSPFFFFSNVAYAAWAFFYRLHVDKETVQLFCDETCESVFLSSLFFFFFNLEDASSIQQEKKNITTHKPKKRNSNSLTKAQVNYTEKRPKGKEEKKRE